MLLDYELAVLWSRGLSDLHVHAGGVRVLQAAWQEIMAGGRNVHVFKGLHKVYENEQRVFQSDIDKAREHRVALLKAVLHEADTVRSQANTGQWWRWSPAMLLQERCMLANAWKKALDHSADSEQVTTDLDSYLQHKHRYCRLARQPVFDTYAGLRHFDTRYFGVLKRAPRGPRHPVQVPYASSTRHQMTPIGDACSYLLESKDLRRIELRMAPFENV